MFNKYLARTGRRALVATFKDLDLSIGNHRRRHAFVLIFRPPSVANNAAVNAAVTTVIASAFISNPFPPPPPPPCFSEAPPLCANSFFQWDIWRKGLVVFSWFTTVMSSNENPRLENKLAEAEPAKDFGLFRKVNGASACNTNSHSAIGSKHSGSGDEF